MPDIKLYADTAHYIKHKNLPQEVKERINKKAQQLIYSELDKIR